MRKSGGSASMSTRSKDTSDDKRSPALPLAKTSLAKDEEGNLIYKRRSAAGNGGDLAPSTTIASLRKASLESSQEQATTAATAAAAASASNTDVGLLPTLSKKRRTIIRTDTAVRECDAYCWICHVDGDVSAHQVCNLCPRLYHIKCAAFNAGGACLECQKVIAGECIDTQSRAMRMISTEQLSALLRQAITRMKCTGCEPFLKPVDVVSVPSYPDYIVHPMDISTLEKSIRKKMYGCTEAFLADCKWILHNCIIFNGYQHELTGIAKWMIKTAHHEMSELEICPDCYTSSGLQAQGNTEWFCEPCRVPHSLVWAKMRSFPYWPAKALRTTKGEVDCRFFGEHDRAWVPLNQVFMLSKEPPIPLKQKKAGYQQSLDELKIHIAKLKEKFGDFEYAPTATPFDSSSAAGSTPTSSSSGGGGKSSSLQHTPAASRRVLPSSKDATPTSATVVSAASVTPIASIVASKDSPAVASSSAEVPSRGTFGVLKLKVRHSNEWHVPPATTSPAAMRSRQHKINRRSSSAPRTEGTTGVSADDANGSGEGGQKKVNELEQPTSNDDESRIVSRARSEPPSTSTTVTSSNSSGVAKNNIFAVLDKPHASVGVDCDNSKMDSVALPSASVETGQVIQVNTLTSASADSDNSTVRKLLNIACDEQKQESETNDAVVIGSIVSCNNDTKMEEVPDTLTSPVNQLRDVNEPDTTGSTAVGSDSNAEFPMTSSPSADGQQLQQQQQQQLPSAKKSSSLDHLVATCRAKLGLDGDVEDGGSEVSEGSHSDAETEPVTVAADSAQQPDPDLGASNVENNAAAAAGGFEIMDTAGLETSACNGENHQSTQLQEQKTLQLAASASVVSGASQLSEDIADTPASPVNSEDQSQSLSKIIPSQLSTKVTELIVEEGGGVDDERRSRPVSPGSSSDSCGLVIDLDNGQQHGTVNSTALSAAPRTSFVSSLSFPSSVESSAEEPLVGGKRKASTSTVFSTGGPTQVKRQAIDNTAVGSWSSSSSRQEVVPEPTRATRVLSVRDRESASRSSTGSADARTILELSHANLSDDASVTFDGIGFDMNKYLSQVESSVNQALFSLFKDFIQQGAAQSIHSQMEKELERIKTLHQLELREIKHNADLRVAEIKAALKRDKDDSMAETKRQFEAERDRAVQQAIQLTKKKPWCANCWKEAQFYCCWNTSYCGYDCQQAHWPDHMASCTQTSSSASSAAASAPLPTGLPQQQAPSSTVRYDRTAVASPPSVLSAGRKTGADEWRGGVQDKGGRSPLVSPPVRNNSRPSPGGAITSYRNIAAANPAPVNYGSSVLVPHTQAQQLFHVTNGDSVQYMSSSMGSGPMSAASNFNTSYRMQQQPGTNSSGGRNNSGGGQGQFFYTQQLPPTLPRQPSIPQGDYSTYPGGRHF